jgi:hypothetical protein
VLGIGKIRTKKHKVLQYSKKVGILFNLSGLYLKTYDAITHLKTIKGIVLGHRILTGTNYTELSVPVY